MAEADWTQGYVADIGYTHGYYPELHPRSAQFALLCSGWAAPRMQTACELGFGQGLSIAMHAATQSVEWWGTDFNPQQTVFAQHLADVAGAKAHLFDDAFDEFARRPDLPEFDFIALHGIWSWISDDNRRTIADLVRRKLRVGGVVYLSYNTLPGWSSFAPMRHLMTQHAQVMGRPGEGVVNRISGALDFAEKMLALDPIYARVSPAVKERFAQVKASSRAYLAHEYFNRDWHPMYFGDMARWLEPAKLSFACSAQFTEHVDAINLNAEQRQFLADIPDAVLRESTRDFIVNKQFRRDYWIKGGRRLTPAEQREALAEQSIVLATPRAKVPLLVKGHLGEAQMAPEVYDPILDQLSDYQPVTLGALEQRLAFNRDLNFAKILQAAIILMDGNHVVPANSPEAVERHAPQSDRLNMHFWLRARVADDLHFNLSPVTGTGLLVDRFEQMFLLGVAEGVAAEAQDLARFAWQFLASQNQRLRRDGKAVEDPEENLRMLAKSAGDFLERLPVLRALRVAQG
jgi:hypothetical protein